MSDAVSAEVSAEVSAACAALAEHGIAIAAEEFARDLARRTEALESSGSLHVVELALAWACAHRSEPAIRHFERTYFPQATRALRKMKLSDTLAEDVLGWMRFELFVRPEGALIATYSGRGDLGSWVRAIAVHEALKRARRSRREVSSELGPELPMPEPGLVAMRGAYGAEFTRALSESFAALTAQERTLLRQYFLDGLTIDVLARLYKIHRATAARRVAAARTRLVDRVRAALARDLALSDAGIDQVITLSNLDESLGLLLRHTR
jgi:RNA polymerase sigma-70 factor (ECF subfamily)